MNIILVNPLMSLDINGSNSLDTYVLSSIRSSPPSRRSTKAKVPMWRL